MSTSRNRGTPIEYMGGDGTPNVLWVLKPSLESEEGYHCGADISLLSQFAHEDECLFPPFTMLTVLRPERTSSRGSRSASGADARATAAPARSGRQSRQDALRSAAILCERLSVSRSEGDKTWMQIEVKPTFV